MASHTQKLQHLTIEESEVHLSDRYEDHAQSTTDSDGADSEDLRTDTKDTTPHGEQMAKKSALPPISSPCKPWFIESHLTD